MQTPQSRKEDNHDAICEEFLKERAVVLGRAGIAVEKAIAQLAKLDQDVQFKKEQLYLLKQQEQVPGNLHQQRKISNEINEVIDQFNTVRETAKLKYYYLIVTREATGLRRHDMVQEMYEIPAKKHKIQVF